MAGSHTRAVPSSLPLASNVPSGDHATARLEKSWTRNVASSVPRPGPTLVPPLGRS